MITRPSIVAVLGHVDHGKTTLLDTIRKANVAAGEHGGITQHIGAYQIDVSRGSKPEAPHLITFIDTPGHEAFAKMRSRGAAVADIAVLVVAADDSVKPQTKESIEEIKAAGIPMIVAINKIDLPNVHIEKVKSDLAKEGIQVEGFGGDVPSAAISAKFGKGVDKLLDTILLVSELAQLKDEPTASVEAVVIETRVDRGKGMVASIIVKKGTIRPGTQLFAASNFVAKVRAMFDENGATVAEAPPGKPVEVLGFTQLPTIGEVLRDKPTAELQQTTNNKQQITILPDFLRPLKEIEQQTLNVLLKADTAGSLEAVATSLPKRVRVVASGVGEITEADVLQAKASRAIVIGFNVNAKPPITKLAQTEKVIFRTYQLIYELLKELEEVVAGFKNVAVERELGKGKIIAEFPFEKQRVAGTKVVSGRLAKGDSVRVVRVEAEIARAKIKSMRVGKDDVTKVEAGTECGILFDKKVDFALQDAIIAATIG